MAFFFDFVFQVLMFDYYYLLRSALKFFFHMLSYVFADEVQVPLRLNFSLRIEGSILKAFLSVSCNMLEVVHVERSFVFQLSFLGQVLLIFSNFLIHTFQYTSKIYCKDLVIFYRYIIFLVSFYFFRNIFSKLYFCFALL